MRLYPKIVYIFSIWLIAVLAVAYLGFITLPHSGKFNNDFWQSFGNWDGGHYLGIAQNGYSEKFQYAFFPLYPIAINLLNNITGNYQTAAVLISLTAAFLGAHLLYKLISLDFDKKLAEKAVLALLFFPTSFFFLTVYSEGLFFFLAVLTFYLLRKRNLFWVTIIAALASATRLVGLAVVAGVWVEVWGREGISRKNWYLILAPLGFLIYCYFLYQQTGDPFYFITAENHWQRTLSVPGAGFWESLKIIFKGPLNLSDFNIFLDLFFAVFGLGFAIRTFRFLPPSFAVYSLISVGIPLFTPTLSSIPRFLLPVFPVFILVAILKNQNLSLAYQIFSLMLLSFFTALFFSGYWVS